VIETPTPMVTVALAVLPSVSLAMMVSLTLGAEEA
jgi:hypothetical protein